MPCSACHQTHAPDESCGTLISATGWDEPPAAPADELLGATVGSFRLARLLGRGSMGSVYLGEHLAIGSKIAVKVMHRHLCLDREMVRRFHAEARATNLIAHDHIVRIFDLGTLADGRYYLLMEYLEGQPLSALTGNPMAPARAVAILSQLCDALAAAHRVGVIHRDLKPENVFLEQRDGRERVKVLDFGIAKLLEGESHTLAGTILGTPEFMSPEQVSGEPVDARSDLYAVGVLAYQLLTGATPFIGGWAEVMLAHQTQAPPSMPGRLELPPALVEVVLRALSKRPQDRHPSAAELGHAFRRAMEAKPAPAPAPARPAVRRLALLSDSTGRRAVHLGELTRAGAYVLLEERFPALGERVLLEVRLPGGRLQASAHVVQQVPAEKAKVWRMPTGVALQFAEAGAAFSRRFAELLEEKEVPARRDVVAEAEAAVRELGARCEGDLYAVLGVERDAELTRIRRAVDSALARLEPLRQAALPAELNAQFHRVLDRVDLARAFLTDPIRRAEYDGSIGNFRGVLRCLAEGLRLSELESCRKRVLAHRGSGIPASEIAILVARGWEVKGDWAAALAELEQALTDDPLNLELHQHYARLKQKRPMEAA